MVETKVLSWQGEKLKRKNEAFFFFFLTFARDDMLSLLCIYIEHHACGCAPQLAMTPATATARLLDYVSSMPLAPLCMKNGGEL